MGAVTTKNYGIAIPSGANTANLSVVVYTRRYNGTRWIIDNSVKVPVSGLVDFQYETGGSNPIVSAGGGYDNRGNGDRIYF